MSWIDVRMCILYASPCAPLMAPWLGRSLGGARGDIPGNSLGQGSTSTSTLTHVWGAYGAPTLCRRRAADGRRELAVDVVWDPHERFLRGFEWWAHSALHPLRFLVRPILNPKNRVGNAHWGVPKDVFRHAHIVIQPFV